MSTLTIGGVYTAQLHGIAGPWTIRGTATIWAVQEHANASTTVTVQLSDHPDPRRPGHSTYATGSMSELPDGTRSLVSLITPHPGPTQISLGYRILSQRDPADTDLHLAAAAALLADWEPVPDNDEPLGVNALTTLERVVRRVAAGEDAVRVRDTLIRRLRAGNVDRSRLAAIVGIDPSRITQICRPIRDTMSA